jgi:hypothetical protein
MPVGAKKRLLAGLPAFMQDESGWSQRYYREADICYNLREKIQL